MRREMGTQLASDVTIHFRTIIIVKTKLYAVLSVLHLNYFFQLSELQLTIELFAVSKPVYYKTESKLYSIP